MPTINGVNMDYDSGMGDLGPRQSAEATNMLREAFDAAAYRDEPTGTDVQVARHNGRPLPIRILY